MKNTRKAAEKKENEMKLEVKLGYTNKQMWK